MHVQTHTHTHTHAQIVCVCGCVSRACMKFLKGKTKHSLKIWGGNGEGRGGGEAEIGVGSGAKAIWPAQAIERQAAAGVKEANSVVMVVDGQEGLTASDSEILAWLRRSHPSKPVLLAVNKCENVQKADLLVTFLP